MPDLVTHACTALLPAAFLPGARAWAIAVPATLGAVLPDLVSRGPSIALDTLVDLGVALPPFWADASDILHTPLAMVGVCGLLAYGLFADGERREVFTWLVVGSLGHLALDACQDHGGHGYPLLFPLSVQRWELGWFDADGSVVWAPLFAVITAAAWAVRGMVWPAGSGAGVEPPSESP